MSEHNVKITWQHKGEDFTYYAYDRTHLWQFDGNKSIEASAAPEYVGNIKYINPEEALAAAIASCHMMSFLYVASKKKYIVDSYEDHAVAILSKNEKGKMAVTQMYLRPKITFKGENQPDSTSIDLLHQKAHEECFIANSVLTDIIIEPEYTKLAL